MIALINYFLTYAILNLNEFLTEFKLVIQWQTYLKPIKLSLFTAFNDSLLYDFNTFNELKNFKLIIFRHIQKSIKTIIIYYI